MNRISRLAAVCLLLSAAIGLCVVYAGADRWASPDVEAIAADPGAYDGQQVFLFGRVVTVDAASQSVEIVAGEDPERRFTVESVPEPTIDAVDPGAAVQVDGALAEESTVVRADAVVVDYRNGADFRYVYAASLLGGLLAAAGFLWYWRVDPRGGFVPRGDR
ncbi:hypothetical protein [Halohasta salina]|uniref:hypothetical protein n=1 Tax=Halohasta salina TaxID=2961621 RepID=UPI0020A322BA|nr:hypothetical protein [Halohasta salina]